MRVLFIWVAGKNPIGCFLSCGHRDLGSGDHGRRHQLSGRFLRPHGGADHTVLPLARTQSHASGTEVFRAVGGLVLLFLRWPTEPLVEEAKGALAVYGVGTRKPFDFGPVGNL